MTLNNYTFEEFLEQPIEVINEYMQILRYLTPVDTKHKLFHTKFKVVHFIRTNIGTTDIWKIIEILVLLGEKDPLRMPITEFYPKFWSIEEQLEVIVNGEKNLVSVHPNLKGEAVKYGEKVQKFGIKNTLDNLANGNLLDYDKIYNLKYSDVFAKLLMDKTKGDLQHEMQKIKLPS